MINGFLRDAFLGIVRHAATAGAGWLLAHGVISGNQTQDFIGSVFFLGGVAWSVWEKRDALMSPTKEKQL